MMIKIEGNCDPRGTNEYNMALGERRALSAKKYLSNLGVAAERMKTISYGEERILLHGHDVIHRFNGLYNGPGGSASILREGPLLGR